MHNVTFNVPRDSREETTFAVVRATVGEESLTSRGGFVERLREALTDWIRSTAIGRDAWANSSEDFNVGDLSEWIGDRTLVPFLERHGIFELDVDVFTSNGDPHAWLYDQALVKAEELG